MLGLPSNFNNRAVYILYCMYYSRLPAAYEDPSFTLEHTFCLFLGQCYISLTKYGRCA